MHGREPHGAISAAVKSLDEARLAFSKYKLVPAENGGLRVQGLGKTDDTEKEGDGGEARVCELIDAFGPATTRLVCTQSEGTLRELGPWLTRTAPRSTFPADAHLEVASPPCDRSSRRCAACSRCSRAPRSACVTPACRR